MEIKKEKAHIVREEFDEVLFEILRRLRREFADQESVPPYIVFGDNTLKEMCVSYPNTAEKMLEINGVGKNKLEKYCPKFIEEIQKYITENNINIVKEKAKQKIRDPKLKTKLNDSIVITFNLYKQGKTIEEICKERELVESTILGHLLECKKRNFDINIEELVDQRYETEILNSIKENGVKGLGILKKSLPEEVRYFDIEYYIYKYKENAS